MHAFHSWAASTPETYIFRRTNIVVICSNIAESSICSVAARMAAPNTDLESADIWGNDIIDDEIKKASVEEIKQRIRLLDNDIRVMKSESQRLNHEVCPF